MSTLQGRKARKENNNGKFHQKNSASNTTNHHTKYNFPDLTDQELEHVKKTIKNKLISYNRTNTIVFSIAFVFLILIIYLLIT